MIFSCTKKVLDKVKKHKLLSNEKEDISLFNWYIASFTIDRKIYFLFTNSKTLFSFFLYAGTKKEIVDLENLFEQKLIETMHFEYVVETDDLKKVFANKPSYIYLKSNSRSVLGSMNVMKEHLRHHFQRDDNELNIYKVQMNYYLNEMIMGAMKNKSPRVAMKEAMEEEMSLLTIDYKENI